MLKKTIFVALITIACFQVAFSSNLFSCEFKASCEPHEQALFYGVDSSDYKDSSLVASSSVHLSPGSFPSVPLCCGIDPSKGLDPVDFSYEYGALSSCTDSEFQDLMYFTHDTNGRIGFREITPGVINPSWNSSHYESKLCVGLPDEFSGMDILVSQDLNYEYAGYECMFKTSNMTSGHLSDCDATKPYDDEFYFVWGKLVEDIASLRCTADCRSYLDDRVYSDCGVQISACRNVPDACNGVLYGTWAKLNSYQEVKCSAPWNEYRYSMFTQEAVSIDFQENSCTNTIVKEYPVVMDNEQVIMKIYMCEE